MQLDTNKKGLVALFKPWQVPLVEEIFKRPLKSGEAHKFLVDKDIRTSETARGPVSRASVIFFLNDLVDEEILTYTEYSGKGGWGRKYEMTLTREEFAHKITGLFVNKLLEVFPKESLTFLWPRP
jgi:hypothetical protein